MELVTNACNIPDLKLRTDLDDEGDSNDKDGRCNGDRLDREEENDDMEEDGGG